MLLAQQLLTLQENVKVQPNEQSYGLGIVL